MNKFKRGKTKKKRAMPYPSFDWDELSGRAAQGLKTLIRAAERKLVPDDGLDFSYSSVNLTAMSELEEDYLCDISSEAESSGFDEDIAHDHSLYHEYLVEIINWHLKNER